MNAAIDTGWIPRKRRGGIYCSPRCGCNCTQEDHDRAASESAALAVAMGDGWETEIWENGGWHYRVRKGAMEITPPHHGIGNFTAWYQGQPQMLADAETAADALGFLRQDIRSMISRIERDLAEAM